MVEDGPSNFQFGPDGAIEAVLNAAGFVNVRSRRFAVMISCADGEKYWQLITNGLGGFVYRLRRSEPGVIESVRRLTIESAERYNGPDGIRLPLEVVCAYAEKPAKGRDAVVVPTRMKSIEEMTDSVLQIAPATAAGLLGNEQVAVVDVRPATAYGASRIPYARSLPRAQIEATAGTVIALDALRQIVVYCDDGRLGRLAARTLTEMGYPGVVNLDGGFDAWRAHGLPVDHRPSSNADAAHA